MSNKRPTPAHDDQDPRIPPIKQSARETGKPDQLKDKESEAENRQEALLDEGIEESFPASDPLSAKRIT